jgi:uncharacterized delta-60 repeat protein
MSSPVTNLLKRHMIIMLIFFVAKTNSQWVSNYWGNSGLDNNTITSAKGTCVQIDNTGKSFVAGSTNEGFNSDILLIKYKHNGGILWIKTYNGTENKDDIANALALDDDGNIYVLGTARSAMYYYDLVLLKYSPDGVLLWDKVYRAANVYKEDAGLALALDNEGNIYVTGYCTGEDFQFKILTQKYSANGQLLWSKTDDGENHLDSKGQAITLDSHGYVYVTGYTKTNNKGEDLIVLKYNGNNGEKIWRKTFNGAGNNEDKGLGIAVDENDYIYVCGYVTADANTSNTDAVLLKYSPSGSLNWSRTYNGSGNSGDKAWGIVVDTDNFIYISGYTTASGNNINYLTIKYSKSGEIAWIREYDGPVHQDDKAMAIAISYAGSSNNVKSISITGGSTGVNLNYDYTTVSYKSDGDLISVESYGLTRSSYDIALAIAARNNYVWITGFSDVNDIGFSAASTQMIKLSDKNETENNDNNIGSGIPEKFALFQNYPNPFNPSTTIKFDISAETAVKLIVYDMLGKAVDILINQNLAAGNYSIIYTNKNLASGIYFYELTAGDFKDIKKMTLVK